MKLAFKTIGLSLLVAILLVTIVISIQLAHVNKIREQNFKDVNERISCKVFDRGYKAYYEDGIVPEDEAYEQFCYYITFLNDPYFTFIVASDFFNKESLIEPSLDNFGSLM